MAILSSTGITGFLSSAKAKGNKILTKTGELIPEYMVDFVTGFAGHGWKIWDYSKKNGGEEDEQKESKWKLEIDSIVVRETMTVFELLIQKIRSVKGALNISQASGKIKTTELKEDGNWYITIEDEMSFMPHDIVRCQTWRDNTLKGYWVEISEIRRIEGVDTVIIPSSEFTGDIESNEDHLEYVKPAMSSMSTPEVGDEIVQFGNSELPNRQSAIYLHADEGGQPAIDVLFDIKTKSFAKCLKMRLGGDIPGGNGAKGFYCENGMIRCVAGDDIIYQLSPDGSFNLGKGSIKYDPETNELVFGANVTLTWDNFDAGTKDEMKGDQGEPGIDGKDGINGADGINGDPGKDGVSLTYKGEFASHPANPQNGWYYRNTADKKCYVYQDDAWYQMTVDGIDGINGEDGNDGLDIVWKGDSSTPPANPQKNWVYRDTDNGKVYIYNGSEWVLMVADGNDGSDGAPGPDGMSVFVTYHDSESEPDKPTGNGTTNGWHTNATATVIWMSQKVAESADSGEWGEAIRVKGNTGDQGLQGVRGDNGTSVSIKGSFENESELPATGNLIGDGYIVSGYLYVWGGTSWTNAGKIQGPAGATPYVHIKYSNDGGITFTSNNGETAGDWMGIYTDYEEEDRDDVSIYKWSKTKGNNGLNGTTYYTWIRYADDLDGNGISNDPKGKACIGFSYNEESQIESNVPGDYIWSLIKGTDGQPGLPGADGQPTYTWIAYSDSADGSNMYQIPNDATKYIGIAINKDTAAEGSNPGDYTWSKFRGDDAVVYSFEFTQNEITNPHSKFITTIPAFSDGVLKSQSDIHAYFYQTIGSSKSLCSDYVLESVGYDVDGNEHGLRIHGKTFEIDFAALNNMEYFEVRAKYRTSNGIWIVFTSATLPVVKDGAAGGDGASGIPGCVLRKSEWKVDIDYNNDEELNVGTRYIDIVLMRANNSLGWDAYKCKQTHRSTTDNAPENTDYWEKFTIKPASIFTSLIIAKDAKLDFMTGNEIRILNTSNQVTAGVSGSGSGDTGVRFYAGSDNPLNAPYRVNEDGQLVSTDAYIKGKVEADEGYFKGEISAERGNIGWFKLVEGNLIGYDKNRNKRIELSQYKIPKIEELPYESPEYLKNDVFGLTNVEYSNSGDTPEATDFDFDFNYDEIDSSLDYYNKRFWMYDSYNFDYSGPGVVVFKVLFKLLDPGYVTFDIEDTISNRLASINNKVEIYDSNNRNLGSAYGRVLLDSGNYYLKITLSYHSNELPVYKTVNLEVGVDIKKITIEKVIARTVLGTDGILSRWGANKYLVFNGDVGFEVMLGSYGLKVDSNGIKKYTNGYWTNL